MQKAAEQTFLSAGDVKLGPGSRCKLSHIVLDLISRSRPPDRVLHVSDLAVLSRAAC